SLASANVSFRPLSASSTSGASSLALARRSKRSARVTSPENATRKRSSWFTYPSYPSVLLISLVGRRRVHLGEIEAGDVLALGDLAQRRLEVAVSVRLQVGLDRQALVVTADGERLDVAAVDLVQGRHDLARVHAVTDVDHDRLQTASQPAPYPSTGGTQEDQRQEQRHGGRDGGEEAAEPARQPDGRTGPQAGGCGQAPDRRSFFQDGAGAEEADADHDLRRDAGHVDLVVGRVSAGHVGIEAVDRDQAEQRGSQPDGDVGAQTGGLAGDLALDTDGAHEGDGDEESNDDVAPTDGRLGQVHGERHGLRADLFEGRPREQQALLPDAGKAHNPLGLIAVTDDFQHHTFAPLAVHHVISYPQTQILSPRGPGRRGTPAAHDRVDDAGSAPLREPGLAS